MLYPVDLLESSVLRSCCHNKILVKKYKYQVKPQGLLKNNKYQSLTVNKTYCSTTNATVEFSTALIDIYKSKIQKVQPGGPRLLSI